MLSYIRDVFTVVFFISVFGGLLFYTIRKEFGWIFPAKAKPETKPSKRFQGSAAVWVK